MSENTRKRTWYLWPLIALWRLMALIIELTGRILAAVIGLALIIVGIVLSLTVVGAIMGVPLILFGVMLILRGMF